MCYLFPKAIFFTFNLKLIPVFHYNDIYISVFFEITEHISEFLKIYMRVSDET